MSYLVGDRLVAGAQCMAHAKWEDSIEEAGQP